VLVQHRRPIQPVALDDRHPRTVEPDDPVVRDSGLGVLGELVGRVLGLGPGRNDLHDEQRVLGAQPFASLPVQAPVERDIGPPVEQGQVCQPQIHIVAHGEALVPIAHRGAGVALQQVDQSPAGDLVIGHRRGTEDHIAIDDLGGGSRPGIPAVTALKMPYSSAYTRRRVGRRR
jgi:hypothetical protein